MQFSITLISGASLFMSLDTASAVNEANEIVGTDWMGNNNGGHQASIARTAN